MAIKKKQIHTLKADLKPLEVQPVQSAAENNEPESWTVITALNRVLDEAEDSQLSDEFFETCKSPLAYLRQELGLTNVQIVILAIMVESGEPVSWKSLGTFLDCTRLSMMVYTEEIDELVAKRWVVRRVVHEMGGCFEGFGLAYGVVNALRHNKPFEPEKLDGLDVQSFVEKLERHISSSMRNREVLFSNDEEWMLQLVKANPHLPLSKRVLSLGNIHDQSLLLLVIADYAQWADTENEGLASMTVNDLYPDDYEGEELLYELKDGSHPLIERGYIEHKCADGQADVNTYVLTRKTKDELLAGYTPNHSKSRVGTMSSRFLKSHDTIKAKPLFYNTAEQEQVECLTNLLSTDKFPSVQQRLEEQGMRKGFACLFYGAPGTGKTETVLQIARQTGRDLMMVDIAGLRDKWVGESEKNIRDVFARYRSACEESEVTPILFFNEADAIINKRTENIQHSVDKMDNAIQNIILQELENLEGILIATTNLTSNLDRAFERRFLYKVEFRKPDTDVKAQIWQSMLKDISADDARQLATRFDFSGGQIENVARKRTVDYVLTGKYATLSEIEKYCRAEQLANKSRPVSIGFTV